MISDDQVRQVKESVDLVELMGNYSTSIKKSGSNFVCCCPFHHERTPSMQIYADQQRFHCFGCKKSGDVFTLIVEREALEFHHAVEFLARRSGIELKHEISTPNAKPKSERVALLDAFEAAVKFYENCLWETAGGAEAREYLIGRGLTAETCKRFRIGWAPGRGALLTRAQGLGIDQRLLRELDLLTVRDDQLRDRFFDRITFPICDRFGSPIAISARMLPAAEAAAKKDGVKVGKYVNTAETPIYHKGGVVYNLHRARTVAKDKQRLIIVEGQTGVMAAAQAGIIETVACLGTALTVEHVKTLSNTVGDGRLLLMFDGDQAGRDSSVKAAATCLAAGVPLTVATLPNGYDPAGLLVEKPDHEQGLADFDLAIKLAVDDLTFLLTTIAPDPTVLDNASKLDVADRMLALMMPMPDDGLRDLHLVTVASYLKLERSILKRRAPWQTGTANRPSKSSRTSVTRGLGISKGPLRPGENPPNDDGEHDAEDGEPIIGLHDQGNAERFIKRHGQNLRYCFEFGKNGWFIWTGSHWKQDVTQEVNRLVVETLNAVLPRESEAYRLREFDHAADQVETWLRTSLNQRKIDAVLTVAQKEKNVGVSSSQLNADQWLFACANGTIDLRTGILQPAARDDLITRCSPANFDPAAVSERWTKFLNDLTRSDPAMISYLQRAAGYSMSGSTREEVMFLVHGPGGSGKSTFMSAIETVLGHYAETIDFEMFLASNVGKRETYYAAIESARLIQCEESGDGKRFAEDVVKKVTGGNRLQARHLYGAAYSYVPKFKVWMVTNELPRVSDTDSGFWRRVQVIGCTNEIPVANRDKNFKEWLRNDAVASSALIAWCVAGAKAYFEIGLAPPDTVSQENALYRLANDPLQEFLDEYTYWATGCYCTKAELNGVYKHWVEESNQGRPLSAKAFAKRMEARGAERAKVRLDPSATGPVGCWRGLRLRRDVDPTESNAPSAAGLTPKIGTATANLSDHGSVPAAVPTQLTINPDEVSDTSGTANAGPGPNAGTEKLDASTEPKTTGTAGPQNPARAREDASLLNFSSEQKKHTEKSDPAVPEGQAPPSEKSPGDVSRGTRLARPPNESEDVLDDPPIDDTSDDSSPPF